jgi:hypothetical protein
MAFNEVIFSTAGVVYPLLAGWAWIVVGRRDFVSARRCFWVGTILMAGAMVMFGATVDWPFLHRLLFFGTIGGGLLIDATEGVRWAKLEVLAQPSGDPISRQRKSAMSEKPSPILSSIDKIEQHNQAGQNIGQQNNFYESPKPAPEPDVIYQAGVIVGKVFGGRRSPTDATMYEFIEIKNVNQLNAQAQFEYDGQMLAILSARSRIGLDLSRSQDGMVYGGVIARVTAKAAQ